MIEVADNHQLYKKIIKIASEENVMVNKPLKSYTYTRLGGQADFFVTPETYQDVQEIVKLANEEEVPFTLLGNGSNLIIKDGGIRGIVMNLGKLAEMNVNKTTLVVQSGAKIIQASREALANKLRSEEHTSELQSRGHLVCRLLLEKKNISEMN